jgi:hypothetical protein
MAETEQERLERRANEARAAVAKVWPELLDNQRDISRESEFLLSLSVMDRLGRGYELGLIQDWLRTLPRVQYRGCLAAQRGETVDARARN